jgi:hypothetical protein
MNKQSIIQAIINANLELCQADSSFNDGFIYDLLMDGFKGLSNMTEQELRAELNKLEEIAQ